MDKTDMDENTPGGSPGISSENPPSSEVGLTDSGGGQPLPTTTVITKTNISKSKSPLTMPTLTSGMGQRTLYETLFNGRPRSSSVGQTPELINITHDSIPHQNQDSRKSNEWQKVPLLRQHKRKRLQSNSPPTGKTSVANRFAKLPLDDDGSNSATKRENKPPPILLYGIEDIRGLTDLLNTVVSAEDYKYKIVTPQQLRITSATAEKYKMIIELVRKQGLIGHTFTKKEDRPYRIVIKHLHFTTPKEAITEAIEQTGNSIRGEIINARLGPSKKPLNTFFVNIEPGPNNKLVKSINYIFNTRVSIEDPKKKNTIVQCQRCQQYGHTKNNCLRPYRCVKCAEGHKTSDCPKKDRNSPAKCALCLGNHPANYKGCEVYREIEKRKGIRFTNRKPMESNQIISQSTNRKRVEVEVKEPVLSPHNTPRTYSDVATGNNVHPNSLETLLNKQAEKIDMLVNQLSSLIGLISSLFSQLPK